MNLLLQTTSANGRNGLFSFFRQLGILGIFFLAVLDSSPIPTFGGPDILIVILVSTRHYPWLVYAATATAGSTLGAYLTFRLAREAGNAYLAGKFGQSRVSKFLEIFKKWGTGSLAASTAIPIPFPTSLIFATAGASDYNLPAFLAVVATCRAVRYCALAFLADRYGRSFARMLLHPVQHIGWLLLFAALVLAFVAAGFLFNKQLANTPEQ